MSSEELFQWRTKQKPLKYATWKFPYTINLVCESGAVLGTFAPTNHAYTLDSQEGQVLEGYRLANQDTVCRVPFTPTNQE